MTPEIIELAVKVIIGLLAIAGAVTKKFYFKETLTTWTEQTVLNNVFNTNTNYIQGN